MTPHNIKIYIVEEKATLDTSRCINLALYKLCGFSTYGYKYPFVSNSFSFRNSFPLFYELHKFDFQDKLLQAETPIIKKIGAMILRLSSLKLRIPFLIMQISLFLFHFVYYFM